MDDNNVVKNQLAENMRFYGDMRFKQLTLLMAGLTLAGAGAIKYGSAKLAQNVELLAVLAMLFTAVLWIMEVRSTLYWVANREKVPELWPRPNRASLPWVNATNAVLVLHMSLFGVWLWLGYQWGLGSFWLVVCLLLGAFLTVFSILNYRSLWWSRKST